MTSAEGAHAAVAILALVFGVLGFGELAGVLIEIAKVLFWFAVIIAVALGIFGMFVYKKVT